MHLIVFWHKKSQFSGGFQHDSLAVWLQFGCSFNQTARGVAVWLQFCVKLQRALQFCTKLQANCNPPCSFVETSTKLQPNCKADGSVIVQKTIKKTKNASESVTHQYDSVDLPVRSVDLLVCCLVVFGCFG